MAYLIERTPIPCNTCQATGRIAYSKYGKRWTRHCKGCLGSGTRFIELTRLLGPHLEIGPGSLAVYQYNGPLPRETLELALFLDRPAGAA